MMATSIPEGAPSPRLCLVIKSNPSQEYGYNLHAERGKPQFIGTVDAGSPADHAGLKPGDRIFAVNGHSIIGENHKQVVRRIRENPLQCELLVISEDGEEWYKEHNIPITLSLPNVVRVSFHHSHKKSDSISQGSQKSSEEDPHNASPTPDAHWYAPKEQEKGKPVGLSPTRITSNSMANKPKPRLCRLVKSSPSDEFGFNLHAEKHRGHFIGAVDKNGIGELAGLQMGQRIVGVNGKLIFPATSHKEVVGLIKMNPLQTDLLVASEEVDRWYAENNEEFSFDYADRYNAGNTSRKETSSEGSASSEREHSVRHDSSSEHSIHSKKEGEMKHKTAANFSRIALEDSPIGILQRERELNESTNIITTNHSDKNFTHKAIDSDANGIVSSHHDNTPTNKVDLIQKAVELPNQPLNQSVHQYYDSPPATKVTASVAPIRQPSPITERRESTGKHGQRGDDIFMMSAKEARSMLVHRKKDPRRDVQMTLEEKYKLITNM
uniref:Na(+)/H(+) exchange regulatory cofactor NHE-RF1 n=1 Tax=Ascaris suum TaxID=6253 RepID=F1L471_ASCSU